MKFRENRREQKKKFLSLKMASKLVRNTGGISNER